MGIWPIKNLWNLSPNVVFQNKWRKKPRRPTDQGLPDKWLLNTHTHNRFMGLFPRLPGEPCPKKSSSGLYGARGDIRGRRTDNPAERHSIRTNQWPTFIIPPFLHWMPFLQQPSHFIWLATGTKYAGLHTQWRGSTCPNFAEFSVHYTWPWLCPPVMTMQYVMHFCLCGWCFHITG